MTEHLSVGVGSSLLLTLAYVFFILVYTIESSLKNGVNENGASPLAGINCLLSVLPSNNFCAWYLLMVNLVSKISFTINTLSICWYTVYFLACI